MNIYHVLAASFNVHGWLEAHGRTNGKPASLLSRVLDHADILLGRGFDHLWLTTPFPLGETGRKENASLTSPFCIRNHADLLPSVATREDLARAKEIGLPVLLDLVLNHTSWDCAWVKTRPQFYLKCECGGRSDCDACHEGNYFGGCWHAELEGRRYWTDVLQLDLANPDVWNAHAATVASLRDCGVAGFRVDSADSLIPEAFERTWERPMSQDFLGDLVAEFDDLEWIAETHSDIPVLESYFDHLYDGTAGERGVPCWRDALAERDAGVIQCATRRVSRKLAQGEWIVLDAGNHDRDAPTRRYDDFEEAAMVLTALAPTDFLHLGGNEVGYDAWPEDPETASWFKDIEMHCRPQLLMEPCQVDWRFPILDSYTRVFDLMARANELMRNAANLRWDPDTTDGSGGWCGYRVLDGDDVLFEVVANPAKATYNVVFAGAKSLESRVESAVRSNVPGGPCLDVSVSREGDAIVLKGRVDSFYCKQLVQTACASLIHDAGLTLINNVSVGHASRDVQCLV